MPGCEEVRQLTMAKGVTQHAERARRIPEAACCLSGRHFFQEVGPQSLILALTRGCGLLEEALAIR